MIRLVRIVGYLSIVAGAIVLLTWLIEPLRSVWPFLLALPLPVKIGLGAAGVGVVLILGSMIWERLERREEERSLLDDS